MPLFEACPSCWPLNPPYSSDLRILFCLVLRMRVDGHLTSSAHPPAKLTLTFLAGPSALSHTFLGT